MEPLDSTLSARVSGIDAAQAAALWQGGGTVAMPAGANGSHTFEITLPQAHKRLAWWSTGPMAHEALPDYRRRMHGAVGRTSHTMHRRPVTGKAGWPPLQHNHCVLSA